MSDDLTTGMYAPASQKRVTVWKSPDKDGDGAEVWIDRYSNDGQAMGRVRGRDDQGNPINHYNAPEGFGNQPGFDHSDNYVRLTGNGQVYRNAKGEAVGIKEGTCLVENPDGTTEVYDDEYGQYLFAQSHDRVGEIEATPFDKAQETREQSDSRDSELDSLRKRLADLEAEKDLRGSSVKPKDAAPGEGDTAIATVDEKSLTGKSVNRTGVKPGAVANNDGASR